MHSAACETKHGVQVKYRHLAQWIVLSVSLAQSMHFTVGDLHGRGSFGRWCDETVSCDEVLESRSLCRANDTSGVTCRIRHSTTSVSDGSCRANCTSHAMN
ncbi:hypothetical protein H310_08269 [Aphanomyces invadans]|uniref:Uncharacterized protein n=1 Tax=Aphanomyces invadans TaxID=157072 RepID=A0A024U029_9STRA|nr:hypothetical protein H310_08269 [Aphanomyces invadans]ETV99618.1 hypothetical protein H310_08269 [Aphanomyces invadans]|eukprot:XP_008872174.1 hypothetical protein H310_08269 [Aphanomyces invadans]